MMRNLFLLCWFIWAAAAVAQPIHPETGYPYTWDELRAMDEFDYANRWDDLGLLRRPYWVTAAEFETLSGLRGVELDFSAETGDLRYFIRRDGERHPILGLKLVILGVAAEVAHEEAGIQQDIATLGDRFYEELPTGVTDLRAYWRKDRGWIYLFPQGGISYVFIRYYKELDETLAYLRDMGTPDPKFELARRYVAFLIHKFDARL